MVFHLIYYLAPFYISISFFYINSSFCVVHFIYFLAPVIILYWSLIFQILGLCQYPILAPHFLHSGPCHPWYLSLYILDSTMYFCHHMLQFCLFWSLIVPFPCLISPICLHILLDLFFWLLILPIWDLKHELLHPSCLHIMSDLSFLDPNFTISWFLFFLFHPCLHIFLDLSLLAANLTISSLSPCCPLFPNQNQLGHVGYSRSMLSHIPWLKLVIEISIINPLPLLTLF